VKDAAGRFDLSPLAREHLVPGGRYDVSDYIGLVAKSPGVQAMVERLQTNQPVGAKPTESGAAFIYREGLESAMEKQASARTLTLALAGRAKNVAPLLAERVPLCEARLLLDVGGGTGIYSIACLQKNPGLRGIIWDRPEVLKVAAEMAAAYGVADRLECRLAICLPILCHRASMSCCFPMCSMIGTCPSAAPSSSVAQPCCLWVDACLSTTFS